MGLHVFCTEINTLTV